jgi:hypothetical protein
MPENQRTLGKDYTGAAVGAEVGAGVGPSPALAGNVVVVAVAFAANACSDRHTRSSHTVHFVLEMVSGVAERSTVDCKQRLRLWLTAVELGAGRRLQSNTHSPEVVLREEGQEEGAVGVD